MTKFSDSVKIRTSLFNLFCFLFFSTFGMAQIGSPGMGKTNSGSWFAVGIKQKLDTLNKWSSTTYLGLGRISNPNSYNPVGEPSMFVISEGLTNRFHKHWEYAFGLSYRRANLYQSSAPYEPKNPRVKQEFRLNGGISYLIKMNQVVLTPTIKQDIRKFYTPSFSNYSERLQLRSRFRLKLMVPLTSNKVHQLLLYSEQLFAVSLNNNPKEWTKFKYKESRFSIYYSLRPQAIPFQFDFGYMHNLVGTKSNFSAHYLALDIIWKNPFRIKQ